MADDFEELLDIEKLGRHQTSTPRAKYNKHTEKTEKIKNIKKKRKESIERQPDEVKKEKGDQNVKKRIKDLAGSEEASKEGKDEDKRHKRKEKTLGNDENNGEKSDDEEEEETEMTQEEKEDMYEAVRNGDYMSLNNALDKKNADINMTWYKENLLMAAIRSGQTDMAEFLIDVGINYNFKTKYFNLKEKDKKGKRVDCYEKSCRDLAYDIGCDHIVEVIDVKNKNVFPFVPITPRTIWNRRPPAPILPNHLRALADQSEEEEEDDSDLDDSNESKLNTEEVDSGQQSVRSNEKTNDSMLSDELNRIHTFGKDEGSDFGSPYHVQVHTHNQPERHRLLYRPTKASMALQTYNNQIYRRRLPIKSAPQMRNIEVVGSYAREKRHWEHIHQKPNEKDSISSVQSVPFFRSHPSSATSRISHPSSATSRRSTTMTSPLAEVTRILGQSRLLKTSTVNLYNSTQRIPSLKINQWCHGNTNSVFNRLSNTNIDKCHRNSNFSVTREQIRHRRR